jgi:hypothetical protein
MCAVLPGNADTSSKSTISAHHTATLRPAMRQSSSAGRSRCAVSPAVERRAQQMYRQQCRAEMPFERGARGSHLAGNSTGTIRRVHDARLARGATLQSCAPRARTHAWTHTAILPSA